MTSEDLKCAFASARVDFQSESKCFLQNDNTPATKHDLYVFASALNKLLDTYENLITIEVPKL